MGWFSFKPPDFDDINTKLERLNEIRDRQDELVNALTDEDIASDAPTSGDAEYRALAYEREDIMDALVGKVETVEVEEEPRGFWSKLFGS